MEVEGEREKDPVVRELPVYLSLDLARQLYLLQYPLRSPDRPYVSAGDAPAVRIKPEQQKIEINVSLDTSSKNFDEGAAEKFAASATEDRSADNDSDDNDDSTAMEVEPKAPMFPKGIMDTIALRSFRVPLKAHYMIGMIAGDKLHLSPVHGISQLRPALAHLEEADRIKIAASKSKAKIESGGSSSGQQVGADGRPYSTTFKRRETEKAIAARKRSHSHLQKQSDAEPWVDLRYCDVGSAEAAAARTAFLSKGEESRDFGLVTGSQSNDSPNELGSRSAANNAAAQVVGGSDECGVLVHIRGLPLRDQVHQLMRRAQVLCFTELVRHVASTSPDEVLPYLRQCARAIDGVWVVKSDYIYDKESHGPKFSLLRRCRDFILLKFRAGESVTRAEIRSRFSIAPGDLQVILEGIAIRAPVDNGVSPWIFGEPPDFGFIQSHNRIIELEEEQWAQDITQLTSPSHRSADATPGSDSTGGMQIDNKASIIPEVWISQSLSTTINENESTLEQCLDALCRQVLQKYGVCKLSIFYKVIALKRGETSVTAVWQNDIGDDDLVGALDRVGAQEISFATDAGQPQSAYIFKTLHGRPDATLQPYRDTVIELLVRQVRVKRHEILVAWEDKGLTNLAQSGYLRILHELAESVSNHWRLKLVE